MLRRHRMNMIPLILKLSRRWRVAGQHHVSVALSPAKRSGTHCTRGWLEHRTFPDGWLEEKEKNSSLTGASNPKPPVHRRSLYRLCSRGSSYVTLHFLFFSVTKVIIPAVLSRFLLRHTSFSFFFQWLRSLYRLCSRGSSYVTFHFLFFSDLILCQWLLNA